MSPSPAWSQATLIPPQCSTMMLRVRHDGPSGLSYWSVTLMTGLDDELSEVWVSEPVPLGARPPASVLRELERVEAIAINVSPF